MSVKKIRGGEGAMPAEVVKQTLEMAKNILEHKNEGFVLVVKKEGTDGGHVLGSVYNVNDAYVAGSTAHFLGLTPEELLLALILNSETTMATSKKKVAAKKTVAKKVAPKKAVTKAPVKKAVKKGKK